MPPATARRSSATRAWAPLCGSSATARDPGEAPQPHRHRPRAVFDDRLVQRGERSAAAGGVLARAGGGRPQRQPDQRPPAAGRIRGLRQHLQIHERHGDHRPSAGQADPPEQARSAGARAEPSSGRYSLVFLFSDRIEAARDPVRDPSAVHRPDAARVLPRGQRELRRRCDRGQVHPRGRAGRDRPAGQARAAQPVLRRSASASRRPTASSSTSISPSRTPASSARTCTNSARSSAASWPRSSRPTADVVIPIPDSGTSAAHRLRRAGSTSRSTWAWSAATTSAGRSSRPTRSCGSWKSR